jgi:repressor LexA
VKELTGRQRELLEYIVTTIDQCGIPPSYRQMADALRIKSLNGIADHLKALERKGYIERPGDRGSSRSIRLTGVSQTTMDDSIASIPLVGRIAAGTPLLAAENYEGCVRIDRNLLPISGEVFALQVTGDSMIEDGIHDGDTLFVQKKDNFRRGEITVVLVDDEATVKRAYRDGDQLRLEPSNQDMSPIMVDERSGDVAVLGIAVGVFRRIH